MRLLLLYLAILFPLAFTLGTCAGDALLALATNQKGPTP